MSKVKSLDLATLDTAKACTAGAEIEIKHPVTQEGLGIFITVYGKDSDTFREYTRVKANAKIRKNAMDSRRGKAPEIQSIDEIERENAELLAACTKSWRQDDKQTLTLDGKEITFSVPEAVQLYLDVRFKFIYDQVNEAIGDLGNFITV